MSGSSEYERLAAAYDPAVRLAHCPDPDSTTLSRIEVNFRIPVEMTQEQQRHIIEAIDDIVDSPWNCPAEGVHWLAEMGAKPHWSRADSCLLGINPEPGAPTTGEPSFDDDVFHLATCARAFVSDHERARKIERRGDRRKNATPPAVDRAIEALEAVADFWGKDPEAFGDRATVTSLAGRFARIADKCRKALVVLKEAKLKAEAARRADPTEDT
ncbi:MAG TPA: hypothetical protein VMV94_07010 [Phycisphaerae bacterium]|nr:hypothetical protein [Phycisphaerae bacterium]